VRVSVVATGIDQAVIERAEAQAAARPEAIVASRFTPARATPVALAPVVAIATAPAPQPVVIAQEPVAVSIATVTAEAEIEIRTVSEAVEAPATSFEEQPIEEDFIPPAPEPIVRAARMPTLEELPAVVQPQLRQARGEIMPPPPQPERRRSLLEKLAAFGISRPEDVAPRSVTPLAPPRQLTAAVEAQRALPRTAPPRPAQGQLDAQGRQSPRPVANDEDQLEIPAFLRRSNGT
jgi:cell division protein FtsZ